MHLRLSSLPRTLTMRIALEKRIHFQKFLSAGFEIRKKKENKGLILKLLANDLVLNLL